MEIHRKYLNRHLNGPKDCVDIYLARGFSRHSNILKKALSMAKDGGMASRTGDVGDLGIIGPREYATVFRIFLEQIFWPANRAYS